MNKDHLDRKQQLLAQAGMHRLNLLDARQSIAASVQPGALGKGAAGALVLAAVTLLKNRKGSLPGINLAALMPLAASGMSLLSKTAMLKPAARKLILAGALGLLVAFAAKKAYAQQRAKRR